MKTIKLSELFDIKYGTSLELNKLEQTENGINFVSRTSKNNGVSAKVAKIPGKEPIPAGTISVAVSGSVLESFLQNKEYYTGYHVMVLTPKKEMTDIEKLYYCMCIKANKFKYSYGRQANKTLPDLLVPSEIPDWVYTTQAPDIEPYREQIDKYLRDENGKLTIKPDKLYDLIKSGFFDKNEPFDDNPTPELNTNSWKEFKLSDLFDITRGKRLKSEDREPGDIPYYSASDSNNGLTDMISNPLFIEKDALIYTTFGDCYYVKGEFTASDEVTILKNKNINKYSGIFMSVVLSQDKFRFSFGRKAFMDRIKQLTIKLPVTLEGEPDYQFMENYMKTLPYSKYI